MKISVDPDKCQGHSRCYALAPELFDVDDYGLATAIDGDVDEALHDKARLAAANCPSWRSRSRTIDRRSHGVKSAHAVHTGARRGSCRAHVDIRAHTVWVEGRARSEQDLSHRRCPRCDIAPDIVGVVLLDAAQDIAWVDTMRSRKPHKWLDLLQASRCGRVTVVPVGDVCVHPYRVECSVGPARVGEVLLTQQYERPLGHSACGDICLGGLQLLRRSDDVHDARRPGGLETPGDVAVYREVELECSGTMTPLVKRTRNLRRDALLGNAYQGTGEVWKNAN